VLRFNYLVSLVFVVAIVVLVLWFGPTAQTLVSAILVSVPLATLVIQRTPQFYLPLKRLWFSIQNTPATWDVSVRFTTSDEVPLRRIAERLLSWSEHESKLISSEGGRFVLRVLRRFVVELHSGREGVGTANDSEDYTFHVSISPFTIGYRTSKQLIETELVPLLEFIRSQISPSRVVYALRVQLPGDNPFLGLYLEQMKLHHIQDFRIEIQIPTRTMSSKVTVARDRMTIVADTLENFRAATTTALAFELPRG
jgi:hypothetical protein